jgi:hypothetical protein
VAELELLRPGATTLVVGGEVMLFAIEIDASPEWVFRLSGIVDLTDPDTEHDSEELEHVTWSEVKARYRFAP